MLQQQVSVLVRVLFRVILEALQHLCQLQVRLPLIQRHLSHKILKTVPQVQSPLNSVHAKNWVKMLQDVIMFQTGQVKHALFKERKNLDKTQAFANPVGLFLKMDSVLLIQDLVFFYLKFLMKTFQCICFLPMKK